MTIKVRRKPLVLEAVQWFPGVNVEGVDYPGETPGGSKVFTVGSIKTLEGTFFVRPGDWIVSGVVGEKWAVRPDIFEQTYELVEDNC